MLRFPRPVITFSQLCVFLFMFVVIVGSDQWTKRLVVKWIPENHIAFVWGNRVLGEDFFRLIHVRNTGIAFSIGDDYSPSVRSVLFVMLPLLVVGILIALVLFSRELVFRTRIFMVGIISGGMGNIIDRILLSEGVVDFLDFKFYGFLGMQRFPTFNLADSFACIFVVLFLIESFLEKDLPPQTAS